MAGLEVVVAAAFCDFPVIVAIILALYNGRSPIDIEETNIAKPYYLSYKSWNAGNRDYYPAVKSTGTAYNDYAGYPGKPIQLLHIDAYRNDGVQLRTGVVVMYRVHVDNRWLPWVSNAEPEWMRKVHAQYNLDGTLDTESYYAGNKGQNINGVEIRIFEENGTDITPTGKSKIIKTPHLNQHDEGYPTGCESVTTVMALRYAGIPISIDYFVDYLPKKLSGPPFDPDVEFGGHPASASGYGCYAPVIKVTCDNCLYGEKKHAEVLRGKSIGSLCSDYIDNNIPVIFWATDSMKPSYQRDPWTVNGKTIRWISPMHCLLLVGYDDYHYIFNDPLKRTEVTYYRKELVETAYKALNQQAVVILKNPPDELIAKKKKQAFLDTLHLLGVSGVNIDKGAFGLFRSSSYDVKVKEYLPGIEIIYSCGFAHSLGFSGDSAVIQVKDDKMVLSASERTKISESFFSAASIAGKEPLIALDHLAAKIGNGTLVVGIRVYKSTIALYITLSYDVEITEYYSESINVSVEFKMSDSSSPLFEPEYVYAFDSSNVEDWLWAGAALTAAVVLVCAVPEFAALIPVFAATLPA